jgi:hypothetical protein
MDLKKILDEHLLWLNGEGGSRADLRGADLSCANLRGASMDQMIWDIHTVFYPLQCPDSGSYKAPLSGVRDRRAARERTSALILGHEGGKVNAEYQKYFRPAALGDGEYRLPNRRD